MRLGHAGIVDPSAIYQYQIFKKTYSKGGNGQKELKKKKKHTQTSNIKLIFEELIPWILPLLNAGIVDHFVLFIPVPYLQVEMYTCITQYVIPWTSDKFKCLGTKHLTQEREHIRNFSYFQIFSCLTQETEYIRRTFYSKFRCINSFITDYGVWFLKLQVSGTPMTSTTNPWRIVGLWRTNSSLQS